MKVDEVIQELKKESSEKYKENVVKMGIPESSSIGVSTTTIRNLAKQLEHSNDFAFELWNTSYLEARILAVLLMKPKEVTPADIDCFMSEVVSWDLCDHLCKNLIMKRTDYQDYIYQWITEPHIYQKRAAFTLIASSMIHDKKLIDEQIDSYLELVSEYSGYESEHVRKAASWALREIGKKDFHYQEKALQVAHELLEHGNKTQKWVAKDAIKELECLVKVEGRSRLISSKSKMGMEKGK
ncbi:MAG: DNA alkylation repair protein [Firmicutes bacterium]|nr:DNA alkylation repair protein [Bacillota bacterium]